MEDNEFRKIAGLNGYVIMIDQKLIVNYRVTVTDPIFIQILVPQATTIFINLFELLLSCQHDHFTADPFDAKRQN